MRDFAPLPRPLLRAGQAIVVAALLFSALHAVSGVGGPTADRLTADWIHNALMVVAAAAVVVRAVSVRAERGVWICVAVALGAYAVGETTLEPVLLADGVAAVSLGLRRRLAGLLPAELHGARPARPHPHPAIPRLALARRVDRGPRRRGLRRRAALPDDRRRRRGGRRHRDHQPRLPARRPDPADDRDRGVRPHRVAARPPVVLPRPGPGHRRRRRHGLRLPDRPGDLGRRLALGPALPVGDARRRRRRVAARRGTPGCQRRGLARVRRARRPSPSRRSGSPSTGRSRS